VISRSSSLAEVPVKPLLAVKSVAEVRDRVPIEGISQNSYCLGQSESIKSYHGIVIYRKNSTRLDVMLQCNNKQALYSGEKVY